LILSKWQPISIKYQGNFGKFIIYKFSTLYFYANHDLHPLFEIKSDVGALSKIEKFVHFSFEIFILILQSYRRGKPSYKGPLAYTPANRSRETLFSTGEINTNLRG